MMLRFAVLCALVAGSAAAEESAVAPPKPAPAPAAAPTVAAAVSPAPTTTPSEGNHSAVAPTTATAATTTATPSAEMSAALKALPAAPDGAPSLAVEPAAAAKDGKTTTQPAAPAGPHTPTGVHAAKMRPSSPEEIDSLLRIGNAKLDQADYVSAEIAFRQVLEEHASTNQDRDALTGLARTYRKKGDYTKAAAVYEKEIKEYPSDTVLPTLYLELGRTLRALGAYKLAISRFYSVINSTLKIPDEGADRYRQLARTAQFEIAETYFQSGDYAEATRFFSRLKLLDLAPEDRARAHFKSAYALTLGGENEKAVVSLQSFLDQNPDDENVPEARYLLSIALRQLGRDNESLTVALSLLRAEQSRMQSDPKRWAYWQRKTGNQLANEFYEHGDFGSALLIYQGLAQLSPDLSWKLPVVYQIGLCQERLQMYQRARECYQSIIDNVKPTDTDGGRHPELTDLVEMATWRLNHLAWQQSTQEKLAVLFHVDPDLPPAPEKAPHDVHGSAANASDIVR